MKVAFPYKEESSDIFPRIKRPIAKVYFWSQLNKDWVEYNMIVDTGADYTILPKLATFDLGIDFKEDCLLKRTYGVGGSQGIYLLKTKMKIKIGPFVTKIPLRLSRYKCCAAAFRKTSMFR